jgi:hypothetical protein
LLKNYPYKERVLLHFENASIPRSSDHCARDSRRVRFPPKIIQIRIERGETIKEGKDLWSFVLVGGQIGAGV